MTSTDDVVLTRRDGRALVITLNRPEKLNAVNGAVARGISAAMDALDEDPSLVVGVIHGAGRAFCAGNDLSAVGTGVDVPITERGFAGIAERPSRKPLIAAVEGYAAGGGFEIALACDMIVAGRSAKLMLPEVTRGLLAGGGGIMRLSRRAPRNLAAEALFTGDPVDAETLRAWGVVNRVTDDGGALEGALELAGRIAANSPVAVTATKRILDEWESWPVGEAFARQRPLVQEVTQHPDAREGARAFLEKRAPQWPSWQSPEL